MPIYEYVCEKCEKEIDLLQKVGDPAPERCENCQAEGSMVKQVSRTSFVLKGGGWYSDLYGSTKKDAASGSTSKDGAKTEAPKDSGGGKESSPAPAASSSSTTPSAPAAASSTPSTTGTKS